METIKCTDPVYGNIELEHIKTFETIEDNLTNVEKLYKMPSGDYIVFFEMIPANLPNAAYSREFHVKKQWVDAITEKNSIDTGTN